MAVLVAAVMAGCGNTASEKLVEDISGDTSVTAEAETPENEETSEAAKTSGTESVGTTAETEPVSEETVPETGADDELRLAQHEDLIGAWFVEDHVILIFEEDRYIGISGGYVSIVNGRVKDGKLEFVDDTGRGGPLGSDKAVAMISGDKLIVETEAYGETNQGEFERYTQPIISESYLDGEWYIDNSLLWGWLDLKNGKGTFDPEGKDNLPVDAEISINGDKLILTIEDYTEEYVYYTLVHPWSDMRFVFLLNDETGFEIVQY